MDACVNALRGATREVHDEYDREDVFVKSFRRCGFSFRFNGFLHDSNSFGGSVFLVIFDEVIS